MGGWPPLPDAERVNVEDVAGLERRLTAVPSGMVDYEEITSSSSAFTSKTDISGLSVTVTHPAGRLIAVTFTGHLQSSVAGDLIFLWIDNSAGSLVRADVPIIKAGNGQYTNLEAIIEPSSGQETYQIAGQRFSGSGTCIIPAEAARPARITVSDRGAA